MFKTSIIFLLITVLGSLATENLKDIDLTFIKNWILGHYDPVDYPDKFTQANSSYTVNDPNKLFFFHKEALTAFYRMSDAAK